MLQNLTIHSSPAKSQAWYFAVVSCCGKAFYTLFDRYDADLSGLMSNFNLSTVSWAQSRVGLRCYYALSFVSPQRHRSQNGQGLQRNDYDRVWSYVFA